MLAYVPVRFDLYRQIRAPLRWTMQCLVAFTDKAGQCFPSVRKLAEVAGISKSTVSRHLAELSRDGRISRHRKPGGVYVYTIDSAFLPAAREVSHASGSRVPPAPSGVSRPRRAEEKTLKKTDDDLSWRARLRRFHEQGLWVARHGPMPGEPGCQAPPHLLAQWASTVGQVKRPA